MASRNRFCRQYLQNLDTVIFWFNYLQKVNAMPSDFWLKKKVLPLWQITFDSLKKYKKLFINGAKLVFFIRNLRVFCIYFLQIMRVLPAKSISWYHLILMKNSPLFMMAFMILREITLDFSDKVFSLRIWGYFIQQWNYNQSLYIMTKLNSLYI